MTERDYVVNAKATAAMRTLIETMKATPKVANRAWLLARVEAHTKAIKELQDQLDALGGDDETESR